MEILIEKKKHKVIYIEYQDRLPRIVVTIAFIETAKTPYWRPYFWDFFACDGDIDNIMAYNSGSGSAIDKLPSPHYIDTYKGASYWIDDCAKLEKESINIQKLSNPILLKVDDISSTNPFDVASITYSHEYCDVCGHSSDEFCFEHKYEDKDGDARYKHDNSCE